MKIKNIFILISICTFNGIQGYDITLTNESKIPLDVYIHLFWSGNRLGAKNSDAPMHLDASGGSAIFHTGADQLNEINIYDNVGKHWINLEQKNSKGDYVWGDVTGNFDGTIMLNNKKGFYVKANGVAGTATFGGIPEGEIWKYEAAKGPHEAPSGKAGG